MISIKITCCSHIVLYSAASSIAQVTLSTWLRNYFLCELSICRCHQPIYQKELWHICPYSWHFLLFGASFPTFLFPRYGTMLVCHYAHNMISNGYYIILLSNGYYIIHMLLYQHGCIFPRWPYFGLYSHLATWTQTLCSSSLLQSVSWYSLSVHHDDDNDDDDY